MIRVGVIGAGHLGRLHANLYNKVERAHLVGVYDIDTGTGQQAAKDADCRAFQSAEELLQEVDAVNIATPTTQHFELAMQALALGRHLFIEKPITTSVEEADRLLARASEKNCVIQVGHIERFNKAMRALHSTAVSPMFIESHRLATFNPRGTDVAVVLDLMIHDIDIILSLVDSPIKQIDANGVAVVSNEPDIANARIQFENGCVANVTASRISQKKMRKMRLFERDSYISLDFLQGNAERFLLSPDAPDTNPTSFAMGKMEGDRTRYIYYDKLSAPEGNALQMELASFVDAAINGTSPVVSGMDGRKALAVACKISQKINAQTL